MDKEGKQVVFPYVYGSIAFSMGKKGDSYTHKWICYVRGVKNEDLSYLIHKVVFTLHSSFDNPTYTEIYSPPYEIQQVGWGQFFIQIQIYFNHPNMPTVQIPHMLKLHHTHPSGSQNSKKPLCSEFYDEIVFTQNDEYIEQMFAKRTNAPLLRMLAETDNNEEYEVAVADQPLKSITQYQRYLTNMQPQDHKIKLQQALRFVNNQIGNLQQKMRIADIDIQKVYEQIYNKVP